jgi:hypothetical protein
MSTTATSTEPTLARYQCTGCGALTFKWTKPMPQGGWLGEVTFGQYVNKPIQVFASTPIKGGTDWTFQAQDGSFLGHMLVSTYKCYLRFVHFRANDKWPLASCVALNPDPRDSSAGIDSVQ